MLFLLCFLLSSKNVRSSRCTEITLVLQLQQPISCMVVVVVSPLSLYQIKAPRFANKPEKKRWTMCSRTYTYVYYYYYIKFLLAAWLQGGKWGSNYITIPAGIWNELYKKRKFVVVSILPMLQALTAPAFFALSPGLPLAGNCSSGNIPSSVKFIKEERGTHKWVCAVSEQGRQQRLARSSQEHYYRNSVYVLSM